MLNYYYLENKWLINKMKLKELGLIKAVFKGVSYYLSSGVYKCL